MKRGIVVVVVVVVVTPGCVIDTFLSKRFYAEGNTKRARDGDQVSRDGDQVSRVKCHVLEYGQTAT